jgi:hypothetical protein
MRQARVLRFLLATILALPAYDLALAGPTAPSCGDVNGSGGLTSSDALLVLKASVGQSVKFDCPPSGVLLRTGQTTCSDSDGNSISCAGSGQDGAVQAGQAFSYTDNGDGTITDNVTGLAWEKLSSDNSDHDYSKSYTWAQAFDKVAALNTANFGGHNDWRLPNLRELQSLVTLKAADVTVELAFDANCVDGCTVTTCSCTSASEYWSSTSYPFGGSDAMGTYFGAGGIFATSKTTAYRARAVRTAF